jgi:signal peptidase I
VGQLVTVSGESMLPTLKDDQYLVIEKINVNGRFIYEYKLLK